jgi:2-hydroxy-6-oxonona-2,4-dienedioate hydrolase
VGAAGRLSLPRRSPEFAGIQAPVLLIQGGYDRMVAVEVSIAMLNHIADSSSSTIVATGPPFENPAEWTAQVLALLRGY